MNKMYLNHDLVEYFLEDTVRERYECTKCNLYFSFSKQEVTPINIYLFISTYRNFFDCNKITPMYIDITCDEVLIKRLLE